MRQSTNNIEIVSRATRIFTLIQYKFNFSLVNSSDYLLSTDALRDEIKNDLFKIATLKVENKITNLSRNENGLNFSKNGKLILLTLIKAITEKFLIKYYGYPIYINTKLLKKSTFIRTLLEDSRMLIDIPFSLF